MCWDSSLGVRTFGDQRIWQIGANHPLYRILPSWRSPSGQAPGDSAAHLKLHYRCFLPNLAGFAVSDCTEPETWKCALHPSQSTRNLRWSIQHCLGKRACAYLSWSKLRISLSKAAAPLRVGSTVAACEQGAPTSLAHRHRDWIVA